VDIWSLLEFGLSNIFAVVVQACMIMG